MTTWKVERERKKINMNTDEEVNYKKKHDRRHDRNNWNINLCNTGNYFSFITCNQCLVVVKLSSSLTLL